MNQVGRGDQRSSDESVNNNSPMPSEELENKITKLIRFGFSAEKMSDLIRVFSGEQVTAEVVADIMKRHENDVIEDDPASTRITKKAANDTILELYDRTGHDYGAKRSATVKNLRTFLDHVGIESGWRTRDQLIAAVASSPYLAQQYPDQIQQLNASLKRNLAVPAEPQPPSTRRRKRAAAGEDTELSNAKRQKS